MKTKFPISHILKSEIHDRKNEENVWGPEASLSLSSHDDFAPSVAGLFCKNDTFVPSSLLHYSCSNFCLSTWDHSLLIAPFACCHIVAPNFNKT